jgi:hypothetical protein
VPRWPTPRPRSPTSPPNERPAGDTAAAIGKLDGERSDTLPLPSEIALRCLSKRWEAVKRLRADAGKLHRYSIKRMTAAEHKRHSRIPHLKNFLQKRLPQKGYPLSGAEPFLDTFLGERA